MVELSLLMPSLVRIRISRSRGLGLVVASKQTVTVEPTHAQCKSGERMNVTLEGGGSITLKIRQNDDFLEVVYESKYLLQ